MAITIEDKYPNIINYWSSTNKNIPSEINYSPMVKFSYKCLKCSQISERTVKAFHSRPDSCGVCSGKIVIPGYNDILSNFPKIIEYWDYQLNTKNPEEYSRQSGLKVWSKCKKCKQSTLRKIHDMVNFPGSCSVCSGKTVVSGFNDLKTKFPDLALEWNYERNKNLPEETYPFGRGSAWWKCLKNGHEWRCTIRSRTSMGNDCPICSGQKVLSGFNDIETILPELLKYWDYERNIINPTTVTVNSNKIVYWKCFRSHEWEGPISGRSRTYTDENEVVKYHVFDCNRCSRSKRVSKKEKDLLDYCKSLNIKVEGSYTLIKGIEYDVYFPGYKIAIDFNGDYWHSDKIMRDKYNVSALEWHENRKEKSIESGVRLFYIWESDWDGDRGTIEDSINKLIFTDHISPLLLKCSNILT